jgi:hypothetical protein
MEAQVTTADESERKYEHKSQVQVNQRAAGHSVLSWMVVKRMTRVKQRRGTG